MLCRKTQVVPIECVVRGYLPGSAWKEYRQSGTVCGIELPSGLTEMPAARADLHAGYEGGRRARREHFLRANGELSARDLAEELRRRSLRHLPTRLGAMPGNAASSLPIRSLSSAACDDELMLIDEVLTPDSSRFWPADQYAPAAARRRSTSNLCATGFRPPPGTEQPPAAAAGGDRRQNPPEIRRGLRALDGAGVGVGSRE